NGQGWTASRLTLVFHRYFWTVANMAEQELCGLRLRQPSLKRQEIQRIRPLKDSVTAPVLHNGATHGPAHGPAPASSEDWHLLVPHPRPRRRPSARPAQGNHPHAAYARSR